MQYRRAFSVLKAALLCWLFLSDGGRAEPVPDFAINAVVSGSATVSSVALDTKAQFLEMAAPAFTLQSSYGRLIRAKAAIDEIAKQLSTTGVDLTQAISTMSLNRSGPIATYFDPISAAIAKLQKLVTTELTDQLNNLSNEINVYVKAALLDGFKTMATALTSLNVAVNNLRTAATQARAASGTAVTVSPNDVKKFFTTRVISDITNGVRSLRSAVPSLVRSVTSTLGSFQTADEYLVGLLAEATQRVQDVAALISTNTDDVNAYVTTVKEQLILDLSEPYNELKKAYRDTLQADVEANANFQTAVDAVLAEMKPLFDDLEVGGKIDSIFASYIGLVVGLDDDLASFYGSGMCSVVQDLIQVLIENGPNAQFCFSKFGPQVFNFFVLHLTDSEDCYRLQVIRLDKLVSTIFTFVQLMVHDIEDFLDNVERCTMFQNLDNCVPYLETEYKTLLQFTTTKRDYIYRLVQKETNSSYGRLKGCYNNGKHLMLLNSELTKTNIEACRVNGPLA